MQSNLENEPWYRNHLVWLVIAIPSLTVLGCMLTIWLAVSHPETLVHDPVAAVETARTGDDAPH